jgi:hypothetical protein
VWSTPLSGSTKMRRSESSAAVCGQQLIAWPNLLLLIVRCPEEDPDRRASGRVASRRRIFRRAEPGGRSSSTQLPFCLDQQLSESKTALPARHRGSRTILRSRTTRNRCVTSSRSTPTKALPKECRKHRRFWNLGRMVGPQNANRKLNGQRGAGSKSSIGLPSGSSS